jgi:phosphatidylinositol-3-phosphatase
MSRRVLRNVFVCVASLVCVAALGLFPALAEDRGSKAFDHVYVIVLENRGFDDALYNGPSPFLRGLSRAQGLATCYCGVTHPSLPNYLAMIGGDEFGVRDDDPSCFASDLRPGQSCHRLGGDSLVDQLEAAGLTWALYAESLATAGALQQAYPADGPDALYAQKHNPFVYFEQIATNPARLAKLLPLDALAPDLPDKPPNFVFIVPNQCHDGHGLKMCRDPAQLTRAFDAFVEKTVGLIRASPNWTENSAIVVTFDEGESSAGANGAPSYVDCCGADADGAALGGNRIATIVVTKCGGPATDATPANHYALLATIEDGFHLPRLRKAKGAPTLMDLFDRPCR